jgi:uncharacterized membrane protein SirB2
LDFFWLKPTHELLALVSLSGFILRWTWRMRGSELSGLLLTRTLPHVIDTLFLVTGVALAWKLGYLVALPGWLLAKFAGLLAYILLGAIAMRSVAQVRYSMAFFIAAAICFLWIVSVAIWKTPLGVLTLFI